MPTTAILYIAERCNQSCVFCLEEDGGWTEFVDPTTEQVSSELERLHARGARQITFMGGETFFRKDLPRIVSRARSLGFSRIGVTTNGTVLSKKGFIESLCDAGLEFIELSVHAHTPELALAITGERFTFERQAAAMAEIDATTRLSTIVNVVACRENRDVLVDVARHVLAAMPHVPLRFKVKFVSLQGLAADEAAAGRALAYEDVDFVAVGDELAARGVPFWFYNVPLCRLGPHAAHAHEASTLALDETYFDFDHRGPAAYYASGHQLEGRVWPAAACAACSVRPLCPGLEETYRRVHGEGALRPLHIDPVAVLGAALADRGADPSLAPARFEALRAEPRPARFVRPRADGALRFMHPALPEPIDLTVDPRRDGAPAFVTTPRFALAYRRFSDGDPSRLPEVAALLARAADALRDADTRGLDLEHARAAIVAAAPVGFTADLTAPAPSAPPKRGRLPVLGAR
jgi:organic radical activating enzyme